jgi:hypothetical protein
MGHRQGGDTDAAAEGGEDVGAQLMQIKVTQGQILFPGRIGPEEIQHALGAIHLHAVHVCMHGAGTGTCFGGSNCLLSDLLSDLANMQSAPLYEWCACN